jgi:hypothetical protein
MRGSTYIPFPISTEAIAWAGGSRDWMNVANETTEQILRIKFRGMMSSIRGIPIDAQSRELSVALVAMTLSLAQSIPRPSAVCSRDDTTQMMRRGLLHLLFCYAAAGKKPAFWVFQLTQPHSSLEIPATPGEWVLYAGVLEALMDLVVAEQPRSEVRHSACALLVKALRRGFVDPITKPLRDTVRVAQTERAAAYFRERDEAAQWARACMLFFRAVERKAGGQMEDNGANGPNDDWAFVEAPVSCATVDVAHRLLERCPVPKSRMRVYRRALEQLKKQGLAGLDAETNDAVKAVGAIYFARYSCAFAEAKKSVIERTRLAGLRGPTVPTFQGLLPPVGPNGGGALNGLPSTAGPTGLGLLDERRAEVEKFLGVPVEIPNYATFAKGIAEGDTSLMKGDEEIERSK